MIFFTVLFITQNGTPLENSSRHPVVGNPTQLGDGGEGEAPSPFQPVIYSNHLK